MSIIIIYIYLYYYDLSYIIKILFRTIFKYTICNFEHIYCNLNIFFLCMGKCLKKNIWVLNNKMVGVIFLFICGFIKLA